MIRNRASVTRPNDASPPQSGLRPPTSSAGDEGHVPTLPFGTGVLADPTPPAVRDLRPVELAPFRFLVSELPARLKQAQASATSWSPSMQSGRPVAPAHVRPQSSKGRWILALCAMALGMFALLLLIWPDTPDSAAEPAPPGKAAPADPRSAAVVTGPAPDSNAAQQQPFVPATHREQPRLPTDAPSSAAVATIPVQYPTHARWTAPKAQAALKTQSVLASVLAPPPAD